jgi:hypothetical protein
MKSPPRKQKVSEAINTFDAFNHTSSHKLTHAHSKELDKPPAPVASLASYPVQYNETFDEYEFSYHPRRSSKEVLDFTSSRKVMKDKSSKSEEKESLDRVKCFKEDKGHKSDGSEGHHRRKDPDFLHCQCLSPRKESETADEASPSLGGREKKEVFDFTSKKISQPLVGSLKTRKHGTKEHKVDVTRKDVDSSTVSSMKSPRRKEERNVFDFGVRNENGMESEYATLRRKGTDSVIESEYATLRRKGNGSSGTEGEYATLKKKKSSRREVLDFTSGSSREVLDFTSSGDRREVLDFTSSCRQQQQLANTSANTSQEIQNIKSSSEFPGSKCGSREVSSKDKMDQIHVGEPWQETCLGSNTQLCSRPERSSREGFASLRSGDGLSSGNSKEDLCDAAFSPQPPRETIDPPDLFNTNKISRPAHSAPKCERTLDVHFATETDCSTPEVSKREKELSPKPNSAMRRANYKTERSKRIRNRSLEMVLDETNVGHESKSR